MKKCLIFVEDNKSRDADDLTEVVDQLYGSRNGEKYGFGNKKALEDLDGTFDALIHAKNYEFDEFDVRNITNCIEELYHAYNFDSIMISATHLGRMLAPRLAMRLKTGLVADITAVNSDEKGIELIRPAYSGKLMAAIKIRGKGPLMMSVRQNVFQRKTKRIADSEWIEFPFKMIEEQRIELLSSERREESEDIRESEVLIAGGRGASSYFNELDALAEALNGKVAASRKIVDQQIASRRIQVGQSGKTVSPKLYIAMGISGSIQHIEGLKNIEHIIAVNKRKGAPICSIADIVVEGDGKEFIAKLLYRINRDGQKEKAGGEEE